MAIDELRKFFPILRWKKDPRALQAWFADAHKDVGGGYANHDLSDIALDWMIFRAMKHGLHFKQSHRDEYVTERADSHFKQRFQHRR
jgi:hypothetical protein